MQLVTKLQYRDFEKGEFCEEAPRTLEHTLLLIKTYPWETQRHLADVQPTCPSVTIERTDGEYLKIGPGFNNKFCLYLLSSSHQLYEAYISTLNEVCDMVTKFFNCTCLEPLLQKHMLSIGAAGHFETKSFEYKVSKIRFFLTYGLVCLFTLLFPLPILTSIHGNDLPLFFYPFVGLFAGLIIYNHFLMLNHYIHSKGAYLKLSKGLNSFIYGVNGINNTYYKSDIVAINNYSSINGKKNRAYNINEILFRDGTIIKISSMIIPAAVFDEKFPNMEMKYINKWWPAVM